MAFPVRLVLAGGLSLLGCLGCTHAQAISYQPRVELADLAAGLTTPAEGFELLQDEPTEGRFPCALAIAKFTPAPSGGTLAFVESRHAEQAYWVEQLRGVHAIRELLFLTPVSTRPEDGAIADLCQAAAGVNAALLVVYAPAGTGPNSAETVGALYDVPSQKPLATFHASSRLLDEDGKEESLDHRFGDYRDKDARFQSQRAFERHLMACLRELIHRDTKSPTPKPHRWHTPLMERWWLPGRGW